MRLYIYPNRARGLLACIEIPPRMLVCRRCRFACPHAHLCLHLRTQCTHTHAVFRVRIQAVWLQRNCVCEKEGKRDDRHKPGSNMQHVQCRNWQRTHSGCRKNEGWGLESIRLLTLVQHPHVQQKLYQSNRAASRASDYHFTHTIHR